MMCCSTACSDSFYSTRFYPLQRNQDVYNEDSSFPRVWIIHDNSQSGSFVSFETFTYAMGFTRTNARTMSSARVVKSRQSPVDNRRSMEVSITCRINTTKTFAVSFQILLTERPFKHIEAMFTHFPDFV